MSLSSVQESETGQTVGLPMGHLRNWLWEILGECQVSGSCCCCFGLTVLIYKMDLTIFYHLSHRLIVRLK